MNLRYIYRIMTQEDALFSQHTSLAEVTSMSITSASEHFSSNYCLLPFKGSYTGPILGDYWTNIGQILGIHI